jgi:hypothetical protein
VIDHYRRCEMAAMSIEHASLLLLLHRANCIRDIHQRGQEARCDNWVSHFVGQAAAQCRIWRQRAYRADQIRAIDAWAGATPQERFAGTRAAIATIQEEASPPAPSPEGRGGTAGEAERDGKLPSPSGEGAGGEAT